MAKGSRGGRRGGSGSGASVAQSNTPAQQTGTGYGGGTGGFAIMSDSDAQQLRDDMEDMYDSDVTDAIKLYISDSNPNGDGFSHSQNLNYKLDNGKQLNATEKFIDANIQAGMHDIGKNTTLTRYCHDDILQKCGVDDYTKYSESQLKSMLIGTEFTTTAYTSYSYDKSKNPFRVGAVGGNGREVTMNTNCKSDTKVVFGAKKQAEMIVNKGTKQKITNVYFDGTTATPRGKGAKPRIVIETETI